VEHIPFGNERFDESRLMYGSRQFSSAGSVFFSCMRILVADDHAMVREGLMLIIASQPSMEVVGGVCDGRAAWKLAREIHPDIVLMDMSMTKMDGDLDALQATERIVASCPRTKVLALSIFDDDCHIRQSLAAGASGYLLKKGTSAELIEALRVTEKGGVYLDPAVAGHVTAGYLDGDDAESPKSILSPREMEVLMQVAWGYANREIAQNLHLSVKTVEGHKARIGAKLGLTTRAKMTHYVWDRGWLSYD
jgi:two-component system response regulator NreC